MASKRTNFASSTKLDKEVITTLMKLENNNNHRPCDCYTFAPKTEQQKSRCRVQFTRRKLIKRNCDSTASMARAMSHCRTQWLNSRKQLATKPPFLGAKITRVAYSEHVKHCGIICTAKCCTSREIAESCKSMLATQINIRFGDKNHFKAIIHHNISCATRFPLPKIFCNSLREMAIESLKALRLLVVGGRFYCPAFDLLLL